MVQRQTFPFSEEVQTRCHEFVSLANPNSLSMHPFRASNLQHIGKHCELGRRIEQTTVDFNLSHEACF